MKLTSVRFNFSKHPICMGFVWVKGGQALMVDIYPLPFVVIRVTALIGKVKMPK